MTALLIGCCALPFACAALAPFCRRGEPLRALVLAGAAALVALTAVVLLGGHGAVPAPHAGLRLDALSRLLLGVVAGGGALSMADSLLYWRDELTLHGADAAEIGRGVPRVRTYFVWHQLFLGSLMIAAASANLGVSWVAIELTTITSAVLVGFEGGARALEAAWKYVILCSVGLALALLTVIVLYALSGGGGLHALDWGSLQAAAAHFPAGPTKLAFLFALVGLGTKAGLAPLHAWLPDAHSEAPAPVSALLSGVLLATVLCTLVRLAGVTAAAVGPALPDDLLLGAGILSVAVATPFLLVQDDLKRLLAYSSVEQIGLMAIGFGLHSPLATSGALLQVAVHAAVKSGLFIAAGHLYHQVGTKRLSRLHGLGRRAPLLAAALILGVFTLGGLPPFGMFFSELAILQGAFAGDPTVALGLLLLLGVIFGGLAFYAARAVFGPPDGRRVATGPGVAAILAAPVAASLILGLWIPGGLAHGLTAAASLVLGA